MEINKVTSLAKCNKKKKQIVILDQRDTKWPQCLLTKELLRNIDNKRAGEEKQKKNDVI